VGRRRKVSQKPVERTSFYEEEPEQHLGKKNTKVKRSSSDSTANIEIEVSSH